MGEEDCLNLTWNRPCVCIVMWLKCLWALVSTCFNYSMLHSKWINCFHQPMSTCLLGWSEGKVGGHKGWQLSSRGKVENISLPFASTHHFSCIVWQPVHLKQTGLTTWGSNSPYSYSRNCQCSSALNELHQFIVTAIFSTQIDGAAKGANISVSFKAILGNRPANFRGFFVCVSFEEWVDEWCKCGLAQCVASVMWQHVLLY